MSLRGAEVPKARSGSARRGGRLGRGRTSSSEGARLARPGEHALAGAGAGRGGAP